MYRGPKKIHADRGDAGVLYRGPKKIHADRGDAGVHV